MQEFAVASFEIRPATPQDAERLLELMLELARYEKLDQTFENDAESLRHWLFGSPAASALVAADGANVVGYALYFRSFSTFLGRPGFWLEDLYVQQAFRGRGIGKALLKRLASLAIGYGYGRVEWSVLDWNQSAIEFYRSLGAEILGDWRICRLSGERLISFAD